VVHVTPDGENLRLNIKNDYKISQLTPADLENILKGNVTERTPQVVHGSKNTNVLFFWSGHGKYDGMLNWAGGEITAEEIRTAIHGAQDNFRKMLLVMETCFSGSVGENLTGIPGLMVLTAAAPGEKSHADVIEGNIYLSNAFTRVFRDEVEKNPDITIYDLYTQLARHTTASHAMMYNYDCYGSVYNNTLGEYFK
jgi:glycosylphosphatidylinositol transamidase (GPIT) subunit GPI8